MDSHLSKLAQMHPETRFVKINAEKSPFLAERLRIIMLPTVALVIKGKVRHTFSLGPIGSPSNFDRRCEKGLKLITVCLRPAGQVKDYIVGFDDMGGMDDFDTEVLEWRIGTSGAIEYSGSLEGPPTGVEKKTTFIGRGAASKRGTRSGWEDDSDDDFS